jgi:hypothetical protein
VLRKTLRDPSEDVAVESSHEDPGCEMSNPVTYVDKFFCCIYFTGPAGVSVVHIKLTLRAFCL